MLEVLKISLIFIDTIQTGISIRLLLRLLCYIGRHDYEFISADGNHGILECFYCLQKKVALTTVVHENSMPLILKIKKGFDTAHR